MDTTLDILPGEGETQIITRTRVRVTCDNCGEPAHYKQTYLLPNYRSNPASKAYRHDDCSWCEDDHRFLCKTCKESDVRPEGMEQGSTFPASARFAHMFLKWVEAKP